MVALLSLVGLKGHEAPAREAVIQQIALAHASTAAQYHELRSLLGGLFKAGLLLLAIDHDERHRSNLRVRYPRVRYPRVCCGGSDDHRVDAAPIYTLATVSLPLLEAAPHPLPPRGGRPRVADDPRRLRAGGGSAAGDVPPSRAVLLDLRPNTVAARDHRAPSARLLPQPHPRGKGPLPQAAAADGSRLPLLRPLALRPDPLQQPRVRQERAHPERSAARVLLPHADALRLGGGLPRGRGGGAGGSAGAAAAAGPPAPPGPARRGGPGRAGRQLPPRGCTHRALLRAHRGGGAPAGGRAALPRREARRKGLLPGVRPGGALQARRPRGGRLRANGRPVEGCRRRAGAGVGARRDAPGRPRRAPRPRQRASARRVAGGAGRCYSEARRTSGSCPWRRRRRGCR